MRRLPEADIVGRTAIVGMACRLPGADSLAEFWKNLSRGVESIARFNDEGARVSLVNPDLLRGRLHVKAAGALRQIEYFDAAFFGLTPREASQMDPQIRLFLECAWEALEDAGYAGELDGTHVGVYAGANISGYLLSNLHASLAPTGSVENLLTLIGNDKDYLAPHVAYKLNLKGPAVNVQTACSTSLVAVHMAGQALANHECDLALAGAVTVRVPHRFGYIYEDGGILSPDGHCRAFDAASRGTVPGSGAGIVALKRLADALADGDRIHAVIRGSAVNNDGSAKVGFTAPSVEGQAEVIAQAQAMAGVEPAQIGYIEAHGTATPLGDACEIAALSQVFSTSTRDRGFCAIGSVKTNIGHLEAASGMAGLIKTVLALEHEALPPSLHFDTPNPEIDFAGSAFFVNTGLRDWKRGARPRLAGVSSFGVGGTNAHLIVEEAPARAVPVFDERSYHILALSAKTPAALSELVERFEKHLADNGDLLADICFTANTGRKHFAHRFAAVAASAHQMREQLSAFRRRGEGSPDSTAPVEAVRLATAYRRGDTIDWAAFDAPWPRKRVSLPTYPFQRQRYWIDAPGATGSVSDDSVYSVEWQLAPESEPTERETGDWLMVGDGAIAEALVQFPRSRGERCTVSRNFAELGTARHVVYLGALDGGVGEIAQNCDLLVGLMQAATGCVPPPKLWLVTRGAQAISESDRVTAPWQAAVWGLGRVFALEHPEAWGGLVDLDPQDADAAWSLWQEIDKTGREDQIAVRGGRRFVPRLERVAASNEDPVSLRPDATYLITGGTGGLGLRIAEWLVGMGARRLVLCGRNRTADTRQLEALGAAVKIIQADVTDAKRMAAELKEIDESGYPLRGLVHAAGVAVPKVIRELDQETLHTTLGPKIVGAWNLHRLTSSLELDFFVCFSSLASVLGSRGFGAYAAANQFLDSLAAYRAGAGLMALTVAWGPWEGAGMAAEGDASLLRAGLAKLDADRALRTLRQLLAQHRRQAVVARVDWRILKPAYEARRERPLLERMGAPAQPFKASGELVQLLDGLAPAEKRARLAAYLGSAVVAALGIDDPRGIDPRQGFFDLGMDSLTAVEFRNKLQSAVGEGIALPRTLLFDYPTLEALGAFLSARMAGAEPQARPAGPVRAVATEAIGIIGMGCNFPGGADSTQKFWRLLSNGYDAVTEIPADRWRVDDYYDPDADAPGKTYSRYGAFVSGVDRFDHVFFGISPREAASMDPQQRLLLEVAWQALEHAALPPEELAGTRSGVFVGISTNDYLQLMLRSGDFRRMDSYAGIGNVMSGAAGRLSYVLGLQGPSMSVDTACSSSLVAVHLAMGSLRSGECDLALAGGVNLILSPAAHVNLSRARMLSRDGRCKAFAAEADGFVRGEGCGVVVLKRLADAIKARDRVLAVIHGSAVNQDGRSSGITVPNGPAQQALIRLALADGGIQPADVDYVEAHGTGTSLGDPIEVQALSAVLAEGRESGQKVALGSVKTNIGHLEAAAGIAGLIKVVLSLEHREIPPHLHLKSLNPSVEWNELPVEVMTAKTAWPPREGKGRVAGVSSFGFSGTNAHVVVGEAPTAPVSESPSARLVHRLTISAKSGAALRQLAASYERFLAETDSELGNICYTAECGRPAFPHRVTVAGKTADEMRQNLRVWLNGRPTGAHDVDALSYRGAGYRKVALPTVCFERQRCWFEDGADDRLYSIVWEKTPERPPSPQLPTMGKWLILSERRDLAAPLRAYLQTRGIECHVERPHDRIPTGIQQVVYLAGTEVVQFGQVSSCTSLLSAAQELMRRSEKARLWLVTRNAQPVGLNGKALNLLQAPLWGFGRAVAMEHPEIWGGAIDVDDSLDGPAAIDIADQILQFDGEDQVALRGGLRFVPRVIRDADASIGSPRIEPDASYLVTGGLGALGLEVARWLVYHGARHVVLVGRSGMSAEAEKRVRELSAGGAMVRVERADVQDYERMSDLVEQYRAGPARLRGVVHAAGVLGKGPVAELDSKALESVMGPKVAGAWNLHQITAGMKLDFFLLFSSIASAWGSRDLAGYAAANHFLDVLAHYRCGLGLPALSINWGAWKAGMTGESDAQWLERSGVRAFSTDEGMELFSGLLGSQSPQRVAASVDWGVFLPVAAAHRQRPMFERMSPRSVFSGIDAPAKDDFLQVLESAPVYRRAELLAGRIQEEVARVMGIVHPSGVDRERGFVEMGMDSLMAVELKKRLEALAGRPLHSSIVFNYPSVAAMVAHLGAVLSILPAEGPSSVKPSLAEEDERLFEDLSDADAERLLAQELAAIEGKQIG
jgi:acyl transferase domain-containing protein/acyl carrier protein